MTYQTETDTPEQANIRLRLELDRLKAKHAQYAELTNQLLTELWAERNTLRRRLAALERTSYLPQGGGDDAPAAA